MSHPEPAPQLASPSSDRPLIALVGPTASGKTALALALAERFGAEILSCDSLCVYRGMELGTAKPTAAERARVRHHLLDLYDPDQPCTAGDYARAARGVLGNLAERGVLPLLAGGTGLYLRALLDGLFRAPAPDPQLRTRLRLRAQTRGAAHLHRTLDRFDAKAAQAIHVNDISKVVRAIEVSIAARRAMTEQWTEGRDCLTGYRVLRLGLAPGRSALYERIDRRAKAMFADGLVDETRALIARFGAGCRPFQALGYAQAAAVLAGMLTEQQAVANAQQGHRQYAKRQMTWFRGDAQNHRTEWLEGFGDEPGIVDAAFTQVENFLRAR